MGIISPILGVNIQKYLKPTPSYSFFRSEPDPSSFSLDWKGSLVAPVHHIQVFQDFDLQIVYTPEK